MINSGVKLFSLNWMLWKHINLAWVTKRVLYLYHLYSATQWVLFLKETSNIAKEYFDNIFSLIITTIIDL